MEIKIDDAKVGDEVLASFSTQKKWLKITKVLKNSISIDGNIEISKKTLRQTGKQNLFSPIILSVRSANND